MVNVKTLLNWPSTHLRTQVPILDILAESETDRTDVAYYKIFLLYPSNLPQFRQVPRDQTSGNVPQVSLAHYSWIH
jgi:hypothetical protein